MSSSPSEDACGFTRPPLRHLLQPTYALTSHHQRVFRNLAVLVLWLEPSPTLFTWLASTLPPLFGAVTWLCWSCGWNPLPGSLRGWRQPSFQYSMNASLQPPCLRLRCGQGWMLFLFLNCPSPVTPDPNTWYPRGSLCRGTKETCTRLAVVIHA